MKFELNLQHRNIPDEVLIKDLQRVARKLNKKSITQDEYSAHGQYNASTIVRRFKTWRNSIESAGLEKHVSLKVVAEEILLEDLRRVASVLQKQSVTREQYDELGHHASNTYEHHFNTWNNALEKAGLQKNLERNIRDEQLFENLEEVWITLGRQPKNIEMRRPLSKYSNVTYGARFGSWNKALEKFIEYVNTDVPRASTPLVVANTNNMAANGRKEPESTNQSRQSTIKSGTHKTKREISLRLRFLVMRRDTFKCKNCGRSPATDQTIVLHVDHIKAWANGGETVLENLQTLCSKCNIGKSDLE